MLFVIISGVLNRFLNFSSFLSKKISVFALAFTQNFRNVLFILKNKKPVSATDYGTGFDYFIYNVFNLINYLIVHLFLIEKYRQVANWQWQVQTS